MKVLRFLGVFAFFILVILLTARLLSPKLAESELVRTQAEINAAKMRRTINIDPANPIVIHKLVDYSEGKRGAWYPKNESPILKELVKEKKIPPLVERIGEEPAVLEGVDGIGQYGGSFVTGVPGMNSLGFPLKESLGGSKLVRWSPQGYPIVPNLAKSWTISPDNKIYTFYLRKGVRWSDGHPFTTDDILFWWEKEMLETHYILGEMPLFMRAGGKTARIVKLDDYTFQIIFESPNSLLLPLIASFGENMTASPAHYLARFHPRSGNKKLMKDLALAMHWPTTAGVYSYVKGAEIINVDLPVLSPYIYTTYRSVSPFVAVRNPYYWKVDSKGNQLPYIDRVVFTETNKQSEGLVKTSGQLSLSNSSFDAIPMLESEQDKGAYHLFYWLPAGSNPEIIHPNLNRRTDNRNDSNKAELLRNTAFKRALSVAINRQAIISANYLGMGEPAQVAPQKGSPFYDSLVQKANTGYDPAEANRLLDSLGLTKRDYEGYRTFRDGSRMLFYTEHSASHGLRAAQFYIDDWKVIGIRVIPRERLNQLWMLDMKALRHDLNVWGSEGEYIPYPMPASIFPYDHWSSNFALGYASWYVRGGLWGDTAALRPGHIEPPKGSAARQTIEMYEEIKSIGTEEARIARFKELMRIGSADIFTIGICTAPPVPMVVKNGLKNVPNNAVWGWIMKELDNAGFDTYYFEKPETSAAISQQIKDEILARIPENPIFAKIARSSTETSWESAPVVSEEELSQLDAVAVTTSSNQKRSSIFIFLLVLCLIVLVVVLVSRRYPYVGKRLILMFFPTLIVISIISFFIIQLPPGDFITSYIAFQQASGYSNAKETIENKRKLFNLDKPAYEQYVIWMGLKWFKTFEEKDKGVLQGNLGRSMASEQLVTKLWGDRLLLSFILSICSLILVWSLAIPAGVYSAVRQYSMADYAISFVGFIGMSIPPFLLAIVIMYLSFQYFGISVIGLFSTQYGAQTTWTLGKFVDMLKHIWVPVLIVGISGTAGMIRVMRANLLDELKKPYVTTARAKGVRPVKLLLKYPFRMAINPFISGIGGIIPGLISGGGLVAIVLNLPTLDPLLLNALLNQDMFMAGSILIVLTTLGLIGVLVSDLLLLWLDPRIRYESGSR